MRLAAFLPGPKHTLHTLQQQQQRELPPHSLSSPQFHLSLSLLTTPQVPHPHSTSLPSCFSLPHLSLPRLCPHTHTHTHFTWVQEPVEQNLSFASQAPACRQPPALPPPRLPLPGVTFQSQIPSDPPGTGHSSASITGEQDEPVSPSPLRKQPGEAARHPPCPPTPPSPSPHSSKV